MSERLQVIVNRCVECKDIKGEIPQLPKNGVVRVIPKDYLCQPCYTIYTTVYYANQGLQFDAWQISNGDRTCKY